MGTKYAKSSVVVMVLLCSVTCFVNSCLDEERIGLLNLKQALIIDPNRPALSSWGSGHETNCCLWENITCHDHLRVSQLSLSGIMDYSGGVLNLSVFNPFQELNNLSMGSNRLEGFSGELNISNLQSLDLSFNGLTDIPRHVIKAQKSLKYLNLEFNRFTNLSCIEELGALPALEVLNLGFNLITSAIPESIGALTALKALSFRNNDRSLSGSLPDKGLCLLMSLEELDLSRNNLTGLIPPCLTNLTSLKLLDLSENNFVGTIPPTLFSNLRSLEYVSLSYNHFHGSVSLSSLQGNSKLEVLELDSHNSELRVETENPPWTPLFQLRVLRLSNCKLNELTGALPTFLVNQHELRAINLSHNGISGKIPTWLLTNNTDLEFLSLRGNLFNGPFILPTYKMNADLFWLDVSKNQINEELPSFISSIIPNLRYLNMSTNVLQGTIPPSIGDMSSLELLDLSNNNFSGEVPERLAMGCSSLRFLKLSSNHLQGPLLPTRSNLTALSSLYLDNNHFSGELSPTLANSTKLVYLGISNNLISGQIPDFLGNLSYLGTLVLSDNSFTGHIPDSFCRLKDLTFLDLSLNRFHGLIPSCLNFSSLKYLHLQGNIIGGPIPHVLSRLTSLVTLDLRDNIFSGVIPDWISSFSSLRVLLLKNNRLNSTIPSQICQLRNISILDLSSNKFSGSIPSCLYQIPIGGRRSYDDDTFATSEFGWTDYLSFKTYSFEDILETNQYVVADFYTTDVEEEIEFMSKSRSESYMRNILYYMSGIDLSQNKLVGPIPNELGYLSQVHTLNLSYNHLTGTIPTTFSNLSQIESLDLSYNRLSGHIPPELTQLNSLAVFSVAHNNLSGSTPDQKGQFGTFEASAYEGNPFLCGLPLNRSCNPIERSPSATTDQSSDEDDESILDTFWWGFLVSYVTAFTGFISFLYCSSWFRRRVFGLVEPMKKKTSQHKFLQLSVFKRK